MDGVSRPSVCMYVCTRATAKSNSPILPNFACRISLWYGVDVHRQNFSQNLITSGFYKDISIF